MRSTIGALFVVAACSSGDGLSDPSGKRQAPPVHVVGSSTLYPLTQMVASGFETDQRSVRISVTGDVERLGSTLCRACCDCGGFTTDDRASKLERVRTPRSTCSLSRSPTTRLPSWCIPRTAGWTTSRSPSCVGSGLKRRKVAWSHGIRSAQGSPLSRGALWAGD